MFSVQCFANVEKKKSVIKIFDMAAKDNLLIDNQFGKVNVSLWDKNEVRIDITVSVKSANEDRAQRYLNSVEIVDKRAGDQISMRTIINKQESSSGWNWPWSSKESDNQIQIDYTVSMPKNNALTVINRFGNTNIPSFKAPLAVTSKYGNFTANDLMGSKNDIDVSYGKADIQQMSNGKIDVSYSTLNLESIKTLTIVNRFGKLKIGQVEKIDGRISYSSGRIGLLKESCNLKLDFSGGFRIDQVATSTENVDIQASYSSVNVPVENSDCNFDVTVTHGGFNYGNSRKVIFTQNDDDRKDDQRGYRSTKQYIGKMGNGGNMKIKVVSKFGEVSLK
ncbi:MAG: hypothetical protein EAZ14_11570 [Runella slithyformis]|nr:MAG: hypothetical protein EAZ46_04070 [Runella sp.]TAG20678.1 MAG: hypothetical protein EAZ38_09740 [Cytophagales bacterium]TAG39837.1 MAG: hypothetical protein EAZ32_08655 [Cytophagia bacterium]TAG81497.1 MAG: hypothetical protein EAZ22_07170 [Cytophagales bacterium]TAH07155.1 MAG: hypothetical protein EAZ14_11570 [Runella slithyformis]